jgi:predicted nucleotidyltransferase
MAKKTVSPWRITRTAIAKLARQIAERFHPDKIILFGSYAYGKPDDNSDVDQLVIMPAKSMVNQAVRIRLALDYAFPLDLIVRTPEYLQERLQMDDWFVREILSRGKVLYEKGHTGMDAKGRIRLSRRQTDHRQEADAHR